MIEEADWGGFTAPPHLDDLRKEVRAFLRTERENGGYSRDPAGWDRFSPEFSRKIGARGWIGMTWPTGYGEPRLAQALRTVYPAQKENAESQDYVEGPKALAGKVQTRLAGPVGAAMGVQLRSCR